MEISGVISHQKWGISSEKTDFVLGGLKNETLYYGPKDIWKRCSNHG